MKTLLGSLLVAFALVATPAWALDPCPDAGGTAFLVNTPVEAGAIAGGYNNPTCNLIITASVDPSIKTWNVLAKSFRLTGASVINQLTLSGIRITTVEDITLQAGILKAREDLHLRCTSPGCEISSTPGSVIIASESLDPFVIPGDPNSGPATKGTVNIVSLGPVNLAVASLFGGSRLLITAPSILVKTDPGGGGLCPCPTQFSGGGGNETRLTALTGDLDISGSVFKFFSHVTFESKQGTLNAEDTIIAAATDIQAFAHVAVLMRRAHWTSGATVRVQTRGGCLLGNTCIDAREASVSGFINIIALTAGNDGIINVCGALLDRIQAGFPNLNGKTTPAQYAAAILFTAVICALQGLPGAVIQ